MEEEADAFLPVTEVRAKYRSPAKYDDEITIRTRLVALRSRAAIFAYEIRRTRDGQLLAEGETHHIVINRDGHARAFPPKYAAHLKRGKVGPGRI